MNEQALVAGRRLKLPPGRDFWLFAYGSLMWNPGFRFLESHPALLRGYHRAFCVYSHRYRGTPEKPGLVLGLDRGGACRGRAYRIAARDGKEVADYLHEREMINGVYDPRWVEIRLAPAPGSPMEVPATRSRGATPRLVKAAAYIVDRGHGQYIGKLPRAEIARFILQGHGQMGANIDYLENTVRHLDEFGIVEGPMHDLLRYVRRRNEARKGR